MPVTVIDYNHGAGGLATAASLWDQFLGPGAQMRKAQLAEAQQGLKNQQQAFDVTAEQRAPNLSSLQSAAQVHANEASKSMDDEADRKGAVAAYKTLSPELAAMPTTDMSEGQYGLWKQAQFDNGVKNLAAAAKAHNNTTATVFGNVSSPKGAITSGYNSAGGDIQEAGSVFKPSQLPDMSDIFGPGATPPAGPAPLGAGTPAAPPAGPLAAPAVAPPLVTAPGAPAAPGAPQAAGQPAAASLPNLAQLARISANPFARAVAENAIKMQNELATSQEKQQGIEKGARDVAFGSPEERQKEADFGRAAAGMSHRLDELKDTVGKYGNYEYWNPEGAAKLKSLPMDIADNWQTVAGKQGVLREGAISTAMEHQIPIPQTWHEAPMIRNGTTLSAIEQTKKVLADYVRQHENQPSTKLPVIGLTPEIRNLVGPTRFGKPNEIPTEGGMTAGANPMITSQQEAVKSVPPNQSYIYFDPATGKATKQTRGKEPWAQPAPEASTNGIPGLVLPPIIPRQATRPR